MVERDSSSFAAAVVAVVVSSFLIAVAPRERKIVSSVRHRRVCEYLKGPRSRFVPRAPPLIPFCFALFDPR